MDGYGVARRIRAQSPGRPRPTIVALAGGVKPAELGALRELLRSIPA